MRARGGVFFCVLAFDGHTKKCFFHRCGERDKMISGRLIQGVVRCSPSLDGSIFFFLSFLIFSIRDLVNSQLARTGIVIRPPPFLFYLSSGLLRTNPVFLMWRAPSGVALYDIYLFHVDRIMPFYGESCDNTTNVGNNNKKKKKKKKIC
jgi:hypothetical protein